MVKRNRVSTTLSYNQLQYRGEGATTGEAEGGLECRASERRAVSQTPSMSRPSQDSRLPRTEHRPPLEIDNNKHTHKHSYLVPCWLLMATS